MPPTAEPDRLARLLRQGPRPGKELQALLGLSEHALGRSLRAQPERFLRLGARKTSTYALVRSIQGVGSPAPIFAWGRGRRAALPLHRRSEHSGGLGGR
jgi:hypothetical protein